MKICTGCEKEKPLTEFGRSKQGADGRLAKCLVCTQAYWREWRARKTGLQTRPRGRPPGSRNRTPPKARPLPYAICHRVDRLVDLLQAYGHSAVWVFASETLTCDGVEFLILAHNLLLGSQEIPMTVRGIEDALRRERASCASSATSPSGDAPTS